MRIDKVGLYIGNFDPIHINNINIINTAKEFCTKVWIIPMNYYPAMLPYDARLELCSRMKNIYFRRDVSVLNLAEEFYKEYGKNCNYSELVKYIPEIFKAHDNYEYYFIVSNDLYNVIKNSETDKQLQELYKTCKFVVVGDKVNGNNIVYQNKPQIDLSWVTSGLVQQKLLTSTGVPLITHAMYKYLQNNNLINGIYQEHIQ